MRSLEGDNLAVGAATVFFLFAPAAPRSVIGASGLNPFGINTPIRMLPSCIEYSTSRGLHGEPVPTSKAWLNPQIIPHVTIQRSSGRFSPASNIGPAQFSLMTRVQTGWSL